MRVVFGALGVLAIMQCASSALAQPQMPGNWSAR